MMLRDEARLIAGLCLIAFTAVAVVAVILAAAAFWLGA